MTIATKPKEQRRNLMDEAYLASGVWKCDKSPTGAHSNIVEGNVLKCKYCGTVREAEEPLTPSQRASKLRKLRNDSSNSKP